MIELNELKALELHTAKDITREPLTSVYVDCKEDTFTLVATDGHSMLWKSFDSYDWSYLVIVLAEKCGFKMPDNPVSGYLLTNKKMRKLSATFSLVFTEASDSIAPYAQYEKVIPNIAQMGNDPLEIPQFTFKSLERVRKTYKLLNVSKNYFLPKWSTPIGATLEILYNDWHLLVMPFHAMIDDDVYWLNHLTDEKRKYEAVTA